MRRTICLIQKSILYIPWINPTIQKIGNFQSLPILYGIIFVSLLIIIPPYLYLFYNFKDKVIKSACLIYGIVLSLLNCLAIYYLIITPCISSLLLMLGACLFFISDSTIAVNEFIYPFKLGDFTVMATYIPAQTLIALAMSIEN